MPREDISPKNQNPDVEKFKSLKINILDKENLKKDRKSKSKSEIVSLKIVVAYDLTNSTQFKYQDPVWMPKIESSLEKIGNFFQSGFGKNSKIWKILGDQIVFHLDIEEEKELRELLKHTFNVLIDSCNFVEKKSEYKMSVKAGLWLVPIDGSHNCEFQLTSTSDWIGKNVDIGFRIMNNFSIVRSLCISANSFYFAEPAKKPDKKIGKKYYKVIGNKSLKGVNRNTLYPTIYYCDNRKKIINFENIQKLENIIEHLEKLLKDKDFKKTKKNLETVKDGIKKYKKELCNAKKQKEEIEDDPNYKFLYKQQKFEPYQELIDNVESLFTKTDHRQIEEIQKYLDNKKSN